jgi:ribosome maturation factor RimP
MTPAYEGKKTLRGTIIGTGNDILECEIDGKPVSLPMSVIASGKEELQFK